MALTVNLIPSQVPFYATPFDAQTAFTAAQTLAATGYLNNLNSGQVDLGGANPSSGAGRTSGMWVLDITAIDFASVDETYRFSLFGSNDVAFGNGNVEILQTQDFAAVTAGRLVPTIAGASLAMPPVGAAGTICQFPFTNLRARIVYRYLRCYVTIGGTSPSVTVTSWLSFGGTDF